MGFAFETLGNAAIQVRRDDAPRLTTDPWLVGTCYFGSWALDHPLTEDEIESVRRSPWIWFSHGHPDHLHVPSLELLDRERQTILVSDHYRPEMQDFLRGEGFRVEVLPFKEWRELEPGLRVLSLPNDNQDSSLLIRAGEDLLLDLNDSPVSGEDPFLRREVRRARRSYLLMLCSNDADMLNIVDAEGRSLAGDPDAKKPGTVLSVADFATWLGVDAFCCSSSQHIYARRDSTWANPYRITWSDMQRYWVSPVRLVEPFVTVDLDSGEIASNHPSGESDWSQVTDACGDDDWAEPLSGEEWDELFTFMRRFELLAERLDFVDFTIGGERRRLALREGVDAIPTDRIRGVHFRVPRHSLLEAIRAGYFDELLIGNFMKTELVNARMYPDFTPIVAKLGGNAKVFTRAERRAFRWHYFRRSPLAWMRATRRGWWQRSGLEATRTVARRLGLFGLAKRLRRRVAGFPPLPPNWP
ncbi:MAG: MBL fold metallo-hydrolase [Planctomycetota bacterium]